MKLHKRLLLTIPFVLVVFCYYKTYDPDERCMGGFIDVIILLTFFGFLLLTGVLAANATLSKRQSKKVKFEPVSFFITLTTLLSLVYSLTLRGHTNGDEWVNAQNWNQRNSLSTQDLTLRKNGNFTLSLSEVDIGCSISGSYVKKAIQLFWIRQQSTRPIIK